MRIPAVAIAVAFAGGILLGRGLHLTRGVLGISFLGIFFLLIVGLLFAWRDRLRAEHVLSRIAAGQIELKTPLRWYGHLRSEPARLPWGWRWNFRAWKPRRG